MVAWAEVPNAVEFTPLAVVAPLVELPPMATAPFCVAVGLWPAVVVPLGSEPIAMALVPAVALPPPALYCA